MKKFKELFCLLFIIIIIRGYHHPRRGKGASLALIRGKYEVRPSAESADTCYQHEFESHISRGSASEVPFPSLGG